MDATSIRYSAEAEQIGDYLAANPPDGHRDTYSAMGWARIAQAVLNAQASIRGNP